MQSGLSFLQKRGREQLAAVEEQGFCCHAFTISSDKCGSCYTNARAKAGSYCAKASTCAGCGGTWCDGKQKAEAVDTSGLLKGISYGPSPLLHPGSLPTDDFFCDAAKAQWGPRGRGDLRIMAAMGANAVRLYGNDPRMNHDDFLDYAETLGLSVVPGISDAPYVAEEHACVRTGMFICNSTVKRAYAQNLEKGFLKHENGQVSYHPALKYVIVINEPDLKLPNLAAPSLFAKGIASAIDGMLDAEKEANVAGPKPNFTATFSFSRCDACSKFADHPGIAQMWMLRDAMTNPSNYGLSPNNDLASFYQTRFTNSFNTGNPSWEIRKLFLDLYEQEFPNTPVFIGEYHNPGNQNSEVDLKNILAISKASPLMLGVSFFEWQNRGDEAGHTIFGIFDAQEGGEDLGGSPNPEEALFGSTFEVTAVPCLTPVREGETGKTIPEQITAAYGGKGLDYKNLCQPNAETIVVSEHGFQQIQGLSNATSMRQFIYRTTIRFGADVGEVNDVPESLAQKYVDPSMTFQSLKLDLATHPRWAFWMAESACVADRHSTTSIVGNALSYVCGLGQVDCAKSVPAECKTNIWSTASYVFGWHFKKILIAGGEVPDPFKVCSFGGAAQFSTPKMLKLSESERSDVPRTCIVPVDSVMPVSRRVQVTAQGFREIANTNTTDMKMFINRVVRHMGGSLHHRSDSWRYAATFGSGVPDDIAKKYMEIGQQSWKQGWSELIDEIREHPEWTDFESQAACVYEPEASKEEIGKTLEQVCGSGVWDCSGIPPDCQSPLENKAAFAFGSYFKALAKKEGKLPDPLTKCHFDNTAVFISMAIAKKYVAASLTSLSTHCLVPMQAS
eukprot:TRINITY_DN49124_c0_g1_i1.p1 TRINITY_DN49124_c0_g1~~TRINITY_DN49124_c0_g1_i1.p1  ORF type:complete len:908 (-),score=149.83 TRINITY_DN49124_c0_g1_i1:29-2560(-)